ncbi:MAG: hypothetical protein ACREO3_04195, partial [Arenimonas sp.]
MNRHRFLAKLMLAAWMASSFVLAAPPAPPASTKVIEKTSVIAAGPPGPGPMCKHLAADAPAALAGLHLERLSREAAHARLVELGRAALDAELNECGHTLYLAAEDTLPGDVQHALRLAWLERYLGETERAASRIVIVAGKQPAALDDDLFLQVLINK